MKDDKIPLLDCPTDFILGDASGKLMNDYGRFPCKLKCGVYAYMRHGSAHATLNIEPITFNEHDVLYIEPGSFLLIDEFTEDAKVNYLVLSSAFLEKNTYGIRHSIHPIGRMQCLVHLNEEYVQVVDRFFDNLTAAVNLSPKLVDAETMVHIYSLIQCTFTKLIDFRNEDSVQPQDRKMEIYRDYCDLVLKNYHRWHHVADYADAMRLTMPHLCSTIKAASGRTAGDLIVEAILMDAKAQLKITSQPTKEIAITLGFDNVGFFNRFFKLHTGLTPKVYRNN